MIPDHQLQVFTRRLNNLEPRVEKLEDIFSIPKPRPVAEDSYEARLKSLGDRVTAVEDAFDALQTMSFSQIRRWVQFRKPIPKKH